MRTIFLVKDEEADLARQMERRLVALPSSSGILFAGVSVTPETPETSAIFHVWIGCSRELDESLMDALVRATFAQEIIAGLQVVVHAHRGVSRSSPSKAVDMVT